MISRDFIVHCREHLGINKKGKIIKGSLSSIRDHVGSTGHSTSVEDFCTLDNAGAELDLLIHESSLILRDRPTVNQHRSCLSSNFHTRSFLFVYVPLPSI